MDEKFNFKKFLKTSKDNWIYLEHYNNNLNVHNEGILYVKDFKCLNNRLAEVNGTFIQRIEFESGSTILIDNEKDTKFILSKINVESLNKTTISEELAKEIVERLSP